MAVCVCAIVWHQITQAVTSRVDRERIQEGNSWYADKAVGNFVYHNEFGVTVSVL